MLQRKHMSVFTWKAGRSDKWLVPVRIALSVTLLGHRQLLANRDPLWPVSICLTYNRIWIRCLCHLKVIQRSTNLTIKPIWTCKALQKRYWFCQNWIIMHASFISRMPLISCLGPALSGQSVLQSLAGKVVLHPVMCTICAASRSHFSAHSSTLHTHIKCTCYIRQIIIRMLIKVKIT